MPDPSGTRFAALRPQSKRCVVLATLLIAASVVSLGAQAQPTSGANHTTLVAQNQAPANAPSQDQSTDQAANQPANEPTQLQEVVVTGTLIRRPSAETAEAITVINADSLKAQGVTNVEGALNQVTANTPAMSISSSVGTFTG